MTVTTFEADLQKDPTSVCVYPRTLKKFLDVLGNPTIKTTKGRDIHVFRRSGFPSFADLAGELLGCTRPCEEFRVIGPNLYARLKRISQICADDNTFSESGTDPFGGFDAHDAMAGVITHCFEDLEQLVGARSAPSRAAAKRSKAKIPDGAAVFIMKTMQNRGVQTAVEISELVEATTRTMPPKLDSEGKDRTRKYIRAAIQKLCELELLFLHDGTRVSLTALVAEAA